MPEMRSQEGNLSADCLIDKPPMHTVQYIRDQKWLKDICIGWNWISSRYWRYMTIIVFTFTQKFPDCSKSTNQRQMLKERERTSQATPRPKSLSRLKSFRRSK